MGQAHKPTRQFPLAEYEKQSEPIGDRRRLISLHPKKASFADIGASVQEVMCMLCRHAVGRG
jgi:hypothetical protein